MRDLIERFNRVKQSAATFFLFMMLVLVPHSGWGEDFKLGMSAAFTGPLGGLGIELYRGSMAYFSEINEQGGVNNRKISVIPYDDGYNPIATIQNTVKLVEDEHVYLLFNYVGTPTLTRVLPMFKNNRLNDTLLFFPYTGAQQQREKTFGRQVFNLRASYSQEIEALVDNLVKVGRNRIALFYQIDPYGRSGLESAKSSLARHNLDVVAETVYFPGVKFDGSMKDQVEKLRAVGPDAIICVGAYQACAAFIRDARDAGLNVPICNISFSDVDSQMRYLSAAGKERGKDYTKGLIYSQVFPSYEETSLPAVAEYRRLMDKWHVMPPSNLVGAEHNPSGYSTVSFEGYMNAKVLVEILKRADPWANRPNLVYIVEGMRLPDVGIGVPVDFGSGNRQGLNAVFLTTVDQGRLTLVKDWTPWKK